MLLLGIEPTILGIAISIIFALLPDIDGFLLVVSHFRRNSLDNPKIEFKHHGLPTHYPITYSPLILLAIFLPNIYTLSMVTSVYLHLLVDSFYTSDGIKWLYPFRKTYYRFCSEVTKEAHGIFWQHKYTRTPLYKIEFVLLVVGGCILWINHIVYYESPLWAITLIGALIVCFFIGAFIFERAHVKYVEKKAKEEKSKRESSKT